MRHDFSQFPRDKAHEADHVFGLALEAGAQLRLLGRDARGTAVQIAYAHHHAAHGDQRRSSEPEFLRAKQRGYGHVPPRHELAVGFQHDTAPQAVEHKRLLRLGQTHFPGQARMANGGARAGAGAAVVSADENHIRATLGHARGHGAHARFCHQLDADARLAVGVFQVVNQFGQILDGVDIMMRRRRDQPYARCGMPRFGDPGIHLFAWQLPAFAGLGALRHFDLQLPGVRQIAAGYAEAAAGYLLDGAGKIVAICVGLVAVLVLAAFAAVALAAQPVHGDGQALMRFLAKGTIAHGTGLEALDDRILAFHLVQRNGRAVGPQVHQAAEGSLALASIEFGGILPEQAVVVIPYGLLEHVDGFRVIEVVFLLPAPLKFSAGGKRSLAQRVVEGRVMACGVFFCHAVQPDAADAADGFGKIFVDERAIQADRLKQLRATVALHGGDAHL